MLVFRGRSGWRRMNHGACLWKKVLIYLFVWVLQNKTNLNLSYTITG